MLTLFQSLFLYQGWADAALLSAVHSHAESLHDEWLLNTLHHIVTAQRIMLSRCQARPVNKEKEALPPESFAALVALFRATHYEELVFIRALTEGDLETRFEVPFLKSELAVADGLTHIVLHSQNHRGQCLVRLRENGVKPPALDYILWAKDRPAAAWPVVAP